MENNKVILTESERKQVNLFMEEFKQSGGMSTEELIQKLNAVPLEEFINDLREEIRKKELNEVIDINGSKVFVEDGEVKTILSEEIQQRGYMDVEEARNIGHEIIKKEYQL